MTPESVRVTAPGKLILMGEHAVVYGYPAVVTSLDLLCRVTVQRSPLPGAELDLTQLNEVHRYGWTELRHYASRLEQHWHDYQCSPSAESFDRLRGGDTDHLFKAALGEAFRSSHCADSWGISLRVDSAIPMSSGFGSSAAAASATIAAVWALHGIVPTLRQLEDSVLRVERYQHGRPSGVDHGCIVRGGLLKATRVGSDLTFTSLADHGHLHRFGVYHTGAAAEPTGSVVAAISGHPHLRTLLPIMGETTERFCRLLQASECCPNEMKGCLETYQRCLEQLGVVPAPVIAMVRTLEAMGAGVKICGAGSIAGPGAGALIAYWPEGTPDACATLLAGLIPIRAKLAGGGLDIDGTYL